MAFATSISFFDRSGLSAQVSLLLLSLMLLLMMVTTVRSSHSQNTHTYCTLTDSNDAQTGNSLSQTILAKVLGTCVANDVARATASFISDPGQCDPRHPMFRSNYVGPIRHPGLANTTEAMFIPVPLSLNGNQPSAMVECADLVALTTGMVDDIDSRFVVLEHGLPSTRSVNWNAIGQQSVLMLRTSDNVPLSRTSFAGLLVASFNGLMMELSGTRRTAWNVTRERWWNASRASGDGNGSLGGSWNLDDAYLSDSFVRNYISESAAADRLRVTRGRPIVTIGQRGFSLESATRQRTIVVPPAAQSGENKSQTELVVEWVFRVNASVVLVEDGRSNPLNGTSNDNNRVQQRDMSHEFVLRIKDVSPSLAHWGDGEIASCVAPVDSWCSQCRENPNTIHGEDTEWLWSPYLPPGFEDLYLALTLSPTLEDCEVVFGHPSFATGVELMRTSTLETRYYRNGTKRTWSYVAPQTAPQVFDSFDSSASSSTPSSVWRLNVDPLPQARTTEQVTVTLGGQAQTDGLVLMSLTNLAFYPEAPCKDSLLARAARVALPGGVLRNVASAIGSFAALSHPIELRDGLRIAPSAVSEAGLVVPQYPGYISLHHALDVRSVFLDLFDPTKLSEGFSLHAPGDNYAGFEVIGLPQLNPSFAGVTDGASLSLSSDEFRLQWRSNGTRVRLGDRVQSPDDLVLNASLAITRNMDGGFFTQTVNSTYQCRTSHQQLAVAYFDIQLHAFRKENGDGPQGWVKSYASTRVWICIVDTPDAPLVEPYLDGWFPTAAATSSPFVPQQQTNAMSLGRGKSTTRASVRLGGTSKLDIRIWDADDQISSPLGQSLFRSVLNETHFEPTLELNVTFIGGSDSQAQNPKTIFGQWMRTTNTCVPYTYMPTLFGQTTFTIRAAEATILPNQDGMNLFLDPTFVEMCCSFDTSAFGLRSWREISSAQVQLRFSTLALGSPVFGPPTLLSCIPTNPLQPVNATSTGLEVPSNFPSNGQIIDGRRQTVTILVSDTLRDPNRTSFAMRFTRVPQHGRFGLVVGAQSTSGDGVGGRRRQLLRVPRRTLQEGGDGDMIELADNLTLWLSSTCPLQYQPDPDFFTLTTQGLYADSNGVGVAGCPINTLPGCPDTAQFTLSAFTRLNNASEILLITNGVSPTTDAALAQTLLLLELFQTCQYAIWFIPSNVSDGNGVNNTGGPTMTSPPPPPPPLSAIRFVPLNHSNATFPGGAVVDISLKLPETQYNPSAMVMRYVMGELEENRADVPGSIQFHVVNQFSPLQGLVFPPTAFEFLDTGTGYSLSNIQILDTDDGAFNVGLRLTTSNGRFRFMLTALERLDPRFRYVSETCSDLTIQGCPQVEFWGDPRYLNYVLSKGVLRSPLLDVNFENGTLRAHAFKPPPSGVQNASVFLGGYVPDVDRLVGFTIRRTSTSVGGGGVDDGGGGVFDITRNVLATALLISGWATALIFALCMCLFGSFCQRCPCCQLGKRCVDRLWYGSRSTRMGSDGRGQFQPLDGDAQRGSRRRLYKD